MRYLMNENDLHFYYVVRDSLIPYQEESITNVYFMVIPIKKMVGNIDIFI